MYRRTIFFTTILLSHNLFAVSKSTDSIFIGDDKNTTQSALILQGDLGADSTKTSGVMSSLSLLFSKHILAIQGSLLGLYNKQAPKSFWLNKYEINGGINIRYLQSGYMDFNFIYAGYGWEQKVGYKSQCCQSTFHVGIQDFSLIKIDPKLNLSLIWGLKLDSLNKAPIALGWELGLGIASIAEDAGFTSIGLTLKSEYLNEYKSSQTLIMFRFMRQFLFKD